MIDYLVIKLIGWLQCTEVHNYEKLILRNAYTPAPVGND